jgi:rhamnose transport system permease protein
LTALGNDNVPGVAVPQAVVPLIVLAPMFALALHRLPVGRRIFAIGGNPETARYAGVHLDRIRFCTFVVSGLVCAIAGVISIGRFSSASPDGLLGYELDAITVVFLGGVSVLGGQGRFSGVLWALVLLTCLRSAMQLHNVSAYAQGTAVGSLLIVSLLLSNTVRSTSAAVHARRRRRQAGAPPGRAPAVAPVTTQT